MKRYISKKYFWILCMVVGLAGLAVQAMASQDNPPIVYGLSNDYIRFYWGIENTVDFKIGEDSYSWDVAGRWSVSTVHGDPESDEDDYVDLIPRGHDWAVDSDGKVIYDNGWAPCHKFAYIKVKVGENTPSVIGVSGGSWTKAPAVYLAPDGLGLGKNGRFLEGEWTTSENVSVVITVYLVRDQVRWQFVLTNNSTVSQTVGLQMQGAACNEEQRSGFYNAPVFIPGFGALEYGKKFTGSSIPDYLEKMDSIADPQVVARHLLTGQDTVKPNRVALGNQNDLVGFVGYKSTSDIADAELEMWLEPHSGSTNGDFNPDVRVREPNQGWALCWDRRVLSPGASRKIVTYYGVGAANAVWTVKNGNVYDFDSAVLATQAPRALKYDSTDPLRLSDFSPSEFNIKAYVYNLATDKGVYDLGDVNVKLQLPDGLQLISGKAVQSLGYVTRDSEPSPVAWTVGADGTVSGSLEYFVIAQDSVSGWNQIISRKVLVPAAGSGKLVAGWQLMSVPFTFTNPSPTSVFNKQTGQIFPQYWNVTGSTSGSYRPLSAITPGVGFWLYATGSGVGQFTVASDRKVYGENSGRQSNPISIELRPGWNLVGSPFLFPVYWGQVQFYNKTQNLALPMEKAVTSGWLSSMYFTWNAPKAKYDYYSSPQSLLEPWKGYWIRARKNVTMIINPLQWPGSDVIVPTGG